MSIKKETFSVGKREKAAGGDTKPAAACDNSTKRNIEKGVCSKREVVPVEEVTQNEEMKRNEDGASRLMKRSRNALISLFLISSSAKRLRSFISTQVRLH